MRHTRIIVTHYGGLDALREEECPEPKHGEVRVRVLTAGVALPDIMARRGIHPETPSVPYTPGWDLVGEVERLGNGVSGFRPGQLVAAMPIHGAYAEFIGREDLERAVDYFRQSRERDPDYAPAWAGLSQAHASQANSGFAPLADAYRQAREAAEKALALDPQLVDAHLAMGWIHMFYDWDWEAADTSYRRALDLEPGNAQALRHAALQATTLGRWPEAIDLATKGLERDPLRPNSYNNLGIVFLAIERDTEAEAAFRKALELDPGGAGRHLHLGRALLLQGKNDAALQEMQQETDEGWRLYGLSLVFHALGRRGESDAALAALKEKYAGEFANQIAAVHAFRGEADLAFEWLERAYAQRDGGLAEIKSGRFLRVLANDPRYKAFLRKLKLPA